MFICSTDYLLSNAGRENFVNPENCRKRAKKLLSVPTMSRILRTSRAGAEPDPLPQRKLTIDRLAPDQRDWLRAHHEAMRLQDLALRFNVHRDTMARMLAELGLRPPTRKMAATPPPALWSRPCITCGDTKPRPRAHYMCPRCRSRAGYIE